MTAARAPRLAWQLVKTDPRRPRSLTRGFSASPTAHKVTNNVKPLPSWIRVNSKSGVVSRPRGNGSPSIFKPESQEPGWTSRANDQIHGILEEEKVQRLQDLLKSTCQPWEAAARLGCPREAVEALIEADRKKPEAEQRLAPHLAPIKSGMWSVAEQEYLVEITGARERRIRTQLPHLPSSAAIAEKMGRDPETVKSKMQELAEESKIRFNTRQPIDLDAPINPKEGELLARRMSFIVRGLSKLRSALSRDWGHALRETHAVHALSRRILELIPTPIQHYLAANRPPSGADWQAMAYYWDKPTNPTDGGVYAWVVPPKHKHPLNFEQFVYIGSAVQLPGATPSVDIIKPKGQIKTTSDLLKRILHPVLDESEGKWVKLLYLPKKLPGELEKEPTELEKQPLKDEDLITLAEAVLSVWFGAPLVDGIPKWRPISLAGDQLHYARFGPWGLDKIQYYGLCSHNPLLGGLGERRTRVAEDGAHKASNVLPLSPAPVAPNPPAARPVDQKNEVPAVRVRKYYSLRAIAPEFIHPEFAPDVVPDVSPPASSPPAPNQKPDILPVVIRKYWDPRQETSPPASSSPAPDQTPNDALQVIRKTTKTRKRSSQKSLPSLNQTPDSTSPVPITRYFSRSNFAVPAQGAKA